MARKKTASELAEDIRALEKRLAAAREQQRKLSKAEEAVQNAAVLHAVREGWAALPTETRPDWGQMPEYILHMFSCQGSTKAATRQSE